MKKNVIKFIVAVLCGLVMLCACTQKEEIKEDKNPVSVENSDAGETVKEDKTEVNPLGFENVSFFEAVAKCLEKDPVDVTQEDIMSIHYLAVGPEGDGTITVYVGLVDYVDHALSHDATVESLVPFVKKAVVENPVGLAADLGRFSNIEIFEYYDVAIEDVSFVNNYHQLIMGYFDTNGITDVSPLADYNPETLHELDFTGNNIEDWTALEHIQDKVIVNYSLQNMTDEDGNEVQVPFITMLSEVLGEEQQEVQIQQETVEQTDEQNDENVSQQQPENEEPEVTYSDIDWSALFG